MRHRSDPLPRVLRKRANLTIIGLGIEQRAKSSMAELIFRKSGREIKQAIANRRRTLVQRLVERNHILSEFLSDVDRLRAYMVRITQLNNPHYIPGPNDISSVEVAEIEELCRRIGEIEQEIYRLELMGSHLMDESMFELTVNDLIVYGFEINHE